MNKRKRTAYLNCFKWFASSNLIIFYLLGALYLHHLPTHVDHLAIFFLTFTLFGHLGLLCLLTFIPVGLCMWLWPRFASIIILSVIITTISTIILFIDIFVFNVFSFHVNFLLLKVVFTFNTAEFFGMNVQQTILAYSLSVVFIAIEIGLAILFWRLRHKFRFKLPFYIIIIAVLVCELISEGLYAYAYATGSQSTLQNSRVFPAYMGTQANDFFVDVHLLTKKQIITEISDPHYRMDANLAYPLHPLRYPHLSNPPNIIIIGIDAWRADEFQADTTSNIYQFSKQASIFYNHYSGGNATLPGLYTLYYSIPSLYWDATNIPPVFFDVLEKYHYQPEVFFSAGMKYPPFYRNIFLTVPGMQLTIPGDQPYQRDAKITEYALDYLTKTTATQKPFFMFLFYDSAHSNSLPPHYDGPFEPIAHDLNPAILTNETNPTPYLNLYKNALVYDDHLIGQVLDKLKAENLLNNTVVVITSDHGQEFNDNHKNYWGHVSNFTQYQTKVPLIIYFPEKYFFGKKPQHIHTQTSHYDVMPTLLQEIFKVSNPISDYSIGGNLFTTKGWTILPEGSYNYEGLIAPPYIYNFYPLGVTAVYDMHANLQKSFPINATVFRTYFQDTRAYYKEIK
ncbi:MAG: DUF3413 domain-containing protein [Gammaproteobacteria bacterium]|nr:DUF3413 domain-containing protein [Gammaproteobacteria bacterium]